MSPPAPARLLWGRFIVWLVTGIALGVSLAWISYRIQAAELALIGLFSLTLGAVLGVLLWGGLRLLEFGHRRAAIVGALLIALVAAGAQHWFAYTAYVQGFRQAVENNPKAALARTFNPDFGPAGFWGFLEASSRRRGAIMLWIVDAVLIVGAAVIIVSMVTRRPYCNACRRWYRTTRQGAIGEAAARKLVAELASSDSTIELPPGATDVRYRVENCLRECGPIRVRLSWSQADGRGHAQAWFEPAEFAQIQTMLRAPVASAGNPKSEC